MTKSHPTLLRLKSRLGSSRNFRTILQTWLFLKSIQVAVKLKFAASNGNGKLKFHHWIRPVFIIPGRRVKNRQDRLVVLNRVAEGVIEEMRREHPEFVFTFRGRPVQKMYGAAWRNARKRAGLPDVRVHDLKHTFGPRLRAAGVSLEDRQDLLGHKSGRITTHYSQPELENLISASNKACSQEGGHKMDTLVILRKKKAVGDTANQM